METDIMQLNQKNAAGALVPFFPVTNQKAVINGMPQSAVLINNTQSINSSGFYFYNVSTTNLPAGINKTGYIIAAFSDSKNGQLSIPCTTWARLLVNGVWSAWESNEKFYSVTGVAGLNGWYAYNNTKMLVAKTGRIVDVALQLNAGVVTSGTEMAILPDWAAPLLDGRTFDVACITSGWEVKTGTVVVRGNKLYCGTNITSYFVNISLQYTSKD